ncbi:hypothetical protein R6Q59_012832 [Mikania micrantha]
MEQNFHQEFYTSFDSRITPVSQEFTQENYFSPNQEDSNMRNFEAGSPIPFDLNNRPSPNNRGKEVVDDEEYHSQPTPKASKWIFQKWRRQPKEKSENASSSTLIQNTEQVCLKNPHEDKTEDVEEIPQQKRKWAIPNEDSNKWSQDVLEFYNNGDAPFCYSLFF